MKKKYPPSPVPTLAQRALELQALGMPGAQISFSGRELHFRVVIAPGRYGRLYQCLLKVKQDCAQPDMLVLKPDLETLADGRKIPHTYTYDGKGTRLCLWWPKGREWVPCMKLTETFIPWTAEWLHYFELWLKSGEWQGGGEHPDLTPRRWARPVLASQS